jgi:hypothetical protein
LGRDEGLVLVEKRDFVAIAYRDFALACLALEAMDRDKPKSCFGYRVAAVLAFKSKVHLP